MKSQPHELTGTELQLFASYMHFEVTRDELLAGMEGIFKFYFTPDLRWCECNFVTPVPGVRVTLNTIENALAIRSRGQIATDDLRQWATVLLLCDAYDWEGPEQDEIAERLNDLSMPQLHSPKHTAP